MNPAGIVVQAEASLADLAAQIGEAHHQCESAVRSAVMHAVRAGELLTQAKRRLPHGNWLPWLKANCPFAERTAQAYMKLARDLPKLDAAKAQRVADLPVRDAIKLLSAGTEVDATAPADGNRRSLLDNPPDVIRKTCEQWWDILAMYTLLLDLRGSSVEDIAAALNMPQADVNAVLHPMPPRRFNTIFNCAGVWPTPAEETTAYQAYQSSVAYWVASILGTVWAHVEYTAKQHGGFETAEEARVFARRSQRQAEAHARRGLYSLPWEDEKEGVAFTCCALDDARAALGIEPAQDFILTRMVHFKDIVSTMPPASV
jgi:hypothetical protein